MVNIQVKLNLIGSKPQIPQTNSHSNTHFTERSIYQKIFPLMQGTAHCALLPTVGGHGQMFPAPRENTPVLCSIDCYGLYYCTNMVCIVITFGELLHSIVTNEHRRVVSPQGHADQLFIIQYICPVFLHILFSFYSIDR